MQPPHVRTRLRSPVALRALRRGALRRRRGRPCGGRGPPDHVPHRPRHRRRRRRGARRRAGARPALLPGAELSSVSGEFEDLHVCGYELRHDDPVLRDTLADFRADRGRRIWAMADQLEELGFQLDRSDLRAREAAGQPLGRPHLADAVLAHPANAARLRDEGIKGKNELFPPYLVPGAIAYVARSRPDGRGGHPGHPRRRRPRRLGAPVLGHRPPGDRPRGHRPLHRGGARRDRGLLPVARRGADDAALRDVHVEGPADHGLGRLPRARAREVQRVRGLRALRARAGARPARLRPGPANQPEPQQLPAADRPALPARDPLVSATFDHNCCGQRRNRPVSCLQKGPGRVNPPPTQPKFALRARPARSRPSSSHPAPRPPP